MPGNPIQIGPFIGGLNTYSDPTAVADNELVECENFELDLDGSLKSRPPLVDSGVTFPLGNTGNVKILGYYYAAGNVPYLIGSDGLSSTYYFTGSSWTLITATFAASAMAQFDDKAWLLSPVGEADPGGWWTPSGGFTGVANMPHGAVLTAHKFRLWVAVGAGALANATRLYFSNILGGAGTFWQASPDFVDIGAGDGQTLVQVTIYYNNLLIFRTNSIYSFSYTSDPAAGVISQVVPGVGLTDPDALVAYESYLYFMYDDKAYEFINNRANQINVKVPFRSTSRSGIYKPYSVSLFNQRVIFSFWDVMYVFSLRTRTWTTWKSTVWGSIGRITELASNTEFPQAVLHRSQAEAVAVVKTNLATNPGFETASGTVVVRTNRALNPSVESGLTGWGLWMGSGTAAQSLATSGVVYGTQFQRITWSVATTTKTGGSIYSDTPIAASKQYTLSAWVRSSITQVVNPQLQFWNGGTPTVSIGGSDFNLPANVWTRVYLTAISGASDTKVDFRVYATSAASSLWTIGATLDTDAVLIEETPVIGPYFDGATPAAGDFTYAWTGAANASTSTQSGQGVAVYSSPSTVVAGIRSGAWSSSGSYSIRQIPLYFTRGSAFTEVSSDAAPNGLVRGATYTIIAKCRTNTVSGIASDSATRSIRSAQEVGVYVSAPDIIGVTELRLTVTVPATGYWQYRLYNGGMKGDPDVWWDGLTIVEGVYTGPIFDGATPSDSGFTYAWTGTANASTSTSTTKRGTKTLSVTDSTGADVEVMSCVLQTKNYSYEASSVYKRLFWWGIDAVFRGEVRALVTPITFNYKVTWGQLFAGATWAGLRPYTWSAPQSGTLAIETVRSSSGSGSTRKFVKFLKGLRFRQIFFRVSFDTDGSINTAPVRVFTIMSYVKAKERVSKAIT